MWSGVLISNCKPAKRLQFEKEETGSEDKRLRAWRGDSFRRGRFRRASGGPIFSLAREKIGKKRVLGRVWCILRCDSGRNLIYRYYEHTYSPYGRYGTRRLLRYTRFVNSCDSISAVKTPFVQNLQGSTDSPEFCRGRCPHRPAGQLRICRRFPKKQSILPGRCGHRPLQPVRANLLCISIKIYSRPGVLGREHTCFVVPPKFGSGWTLPSCAGDAGCAGPAISARCALYACSADVLPGAAARAFQRHGPLSGQAESRYCFRVVAKIKIIGSFSCSSSSCANPDRRAAIRGSAFLPRPDLSRTGRWTNRTGEACA